MKRTSASDTCTASSGDTSLGPAQVLEDDPLIGENLQHYRLEARLGHGGMGAVYRALDESLQRYVAVKVLQLGTDDQTRATPSVERLLQEAISQARVSHPNVVHIYYVGRSEKVPFFAMELVAGPTLSDRLADGPLPFIQVTEIGEQIAEALRHAAEYDIVHGDIKTGNVLLADEHHAKLSDFGLSRRLSQTPEGRQELAGTPVYLAPEIIRGGAPNIASDLYALGVTLFEMTFGRLPYMVTHEGIAAMFRAHNESPIRFPCPWPASVPLEWRHVLERLLAKSPADRYANYDDLIADIVRLKPIPRRAAFALPRVLAWTVDITLMGIAQLSIFGPSLGLIVVNPFPNFGGLRYLALLFGAILPLFAAWVQSQWKGTPGKELFQLRVVDDHGLLPTPRVLFMRSFIQLLPICGLTMSAIADVVGSEFASMGIVMAAGALFVVDAAVGFFRSDRRSLHDLVFGTRVVLDA